VQDVGTPGSPGKGRNGFENGVVDQASAEPKCHHTTPLRISLAGGGTDFPDFFVRHSGCVVTSAIDKYVFCIVKERVDDRICVGYPSESSWIRWNQPRTNWSAKKPQRWGVTQSVEISFLADIPGGGRTDWGSSSSVTGRCELNALYHYVGGTPRRNRAFDGFRNFPS